MTSMTALSSRSLSSFLDICYSYCAIIIVMLLIGGQGGRYVAIERIESVGLEEQQALTDP